MPLHNTYTYIHTCNINVCYIYMYIILNYIPMLNFDYYVVLRFIHHTELGWHLAGWFGEPRHVTSAVAVRSLDFAL